MAKQQKKLLPEYKFVRFELSRQEKRAFSETLPPDLPKVLDTLSALLEDCHKVSLSYDAEHSTYVASLTCNGGSRTENHYKILTARASDPAVALTLLLFKDQLLEHSWPTPGEDAFDFG